MIKASGENPVYVSKEVWGDVEADLESHWQSLPWKNIYTNGKRGTYRDVINRFDLVIYYDDARLQVSLVSKEDNETVTFNKTYWMD